MKASSSPATAREKKIHILLAASGSVASIKLPNIAEALGKHHNVSIRIILTQSAEKFFTDQSQEQPSVDKLSGVPGVDEIYRDKDEWRQPWTRGAPILHIDLRKWAHLLLVCPLSANTLAKIALGISDNLLTSVIRCWDFAGTVDVGLKEVKPMIFIAPAMNTAMWRHPLTKQHLQVLQTEWGTLARGELGSFRILNPMAKELACGDVGDGAMMDWREIVSIVEEHAKL